MSDFYDLLKQSIIARGIRSAKERGEVYAQARKAVIKQLWDYRPPLAADEIDMRVGKYDTAVERIEAEVARRFADAGAFVPETKAAAAKPVAGAAAGRGVAPLPFNDWRMDEIEHPAGVERGSPYAPPTAPRQPEPKPKAKPKPANERPDDYETALPLALADEDFDDDDEPADARRRRPDLATWFNQIAGTGEQRKIRLLAAAIGLLFIVLIGFAAFVLGTRGQHVATAQPGNDSPVTKTVSDAATAANVPTEDLQVTRSFALFDGRDPSVFVSLPDNPIRFDSADGFARVGSSASASGVKVAIGPGLASEIAGRRVRIVVTARSSSDQGAAAMRFAYQSGLALSFWQPANLGSDFKQVGMIWRLPAMRTSTGDDFLLIEPGIPGDGTGADIKSIRIDVLAT